VATWPSNNSPARVVPIEDNNKVFFTFFSFYIYQLAIKNLYAIIQLIVYRKQKPDNPALIS
ncbi:MAG: hypothetical protein KAI39_06715, partial [Desulfobulbaceae bacterium]|nr:hypothetical protein [Desulfobulbaceae bacterium]